jgi:hypothetical protein
MTQAVSPLTPSAAIISNLNAHNNSPHVSKDSKIESVGLDVYEYNERVNHGGVVNSMLRIGMNERRMEDAFKLIGTKCFSIAKEGRGFWMRGTRVSLVLVFKVVKPFKKSNIEYVLIIVFD